LIYGYNNVWNKFKTSLEPPTEILDRDRWSL